ncbi:MAG: sigma-70 family RNA polymerase sigma factor [Acidobacteriota bacterium]|nr:sigma-70 family RNA polymerase sigma factor [Acidobacteriota bacterium]
MSRHRESRRTGGVSVDLAERSASIEALLTHSRRRIAYLFASYGIPPLDREDLVQEALLFLVKQWETVLHPEEWFLGTLRYRCCHYIRRRYRERRVDALDPADLEALAGAVPAPQHARTTHLDLTTLASSLPPADRRLLHLRYGLGLSSLEAAAELATSQKTVQRRTVLAKSRLRTRARKSARR